MAREGGKKGQGRARISRLCHSICLGLVVYGGGRETNDTRELRSNQHEEIVGIAGLAFVMFHVQWGRCESHVAFEGDVYRREYCRKRPSLSYDCLYDSESRT